MRRSFWLVLPALTLLALVVLPFGAGAAGSPPSCAISNARNHKDYSSLQNAVDAAKAGDTLEVKGNCVGNTSVAKNITLKGITNKPFPGPPTLDGGGTGTVLHITNGTTTVNGLTIRNGVADVASVEGNGCCVGGGIAVSGDTAGARLVNSLVTGNLTLHGVTKQISFPATIQVSDDAVEVAADFFINRYDFDIKYPGKANDLIRKEVVLKLKVRATPPGKV